MNKSAGWTAKLMTLVAGASLISCAATPDAGEPVGSDSTAGDGRIGSAQEASVSIQEGLELTLSVGSTPAQAGAPIELVLAARNDGDSAVVIDFPNGQRYDFEVFGEDGPLEWRWSDGMFFTMMLGRETLGPGEALRWTERIPDGLPPGTYRIVGTLTAMERSAAELTLSVRS